MGLLKKIFVPTLFLFPLGEMVRINLGGGFIIKPLDIGIGILLISWLSFKYFKKEKIKQANLLLPITLFTLSGLIALITNNLRLSLSELLLSITYLVRWLAYLGIFFVITDFDKEFKRRISKLLIIIGSLTLVLGYLQYFLYPNLKGLFYLGWDEHMYRMFSVFLDPNFAGAFFVLFFLFLADLFFKKKSFLIGLLLVFTLGAIFLTFSRSALMMLIISSSLLFILMNKKIWIAILLGIVFLILVISSRYFNIENINLFRIVSTEARFETARNAIKIIQDYPVFGIGFNTYRYAQLRYGFRNNMATTLSHADASPDNSFLLIAATSGIVGITLFTIFWTKILAYSVKDNPLVLSSVVGICVNSLFINSLFYPFIMLWIWIILALSTKNHNRFIGSK